MSTDIPGVIATFPDNRPRIKYPWKKLEVNQCFLTHVGNRNRVDVQAHYYAGLTGRTFTSVLLPDDPDLFAVYRTA